MERDPFNLSNPSTGNVSKLQFGESFVSAGNLSKIHRKEESYRDIVK